MYQNLFDMHKTVFISLPIEDLQTVIIDCVNSCLKNNTQGSKPTTEQPEQWLALNDLLKYDPEKRTKLHLVQQSFT